MTVKQAADKLLRAARGNNQDNLIAAVHNYREAYKRDKQEKANNESSK